MAEHRFTIKGMPQASVTPDAAVVELVFETNDAEPIRLSFSADDFEGFISRAIQLFTHVRNQKLAIGGHLAVQPVAVVAAAAEPAVGGRKVILSLKASNGVPYHFALEVDEAQQLRQQLQRAVKSARRQQSQTQQ